MESHHEPRQILLPLLNTRVHYCRSKKALLLLHAKAVLPDAKAIKKTAA